MDGTVPELALYVCSVFARELCSAGEVLELRVASIRARSTLTDSDTFRGMAIVWEVVIRE